MIRESVNQKVGKAGTSLANISVTSSNNHMNVDIMNGDTGYSLWWNATENDATPMGLYDFTNQTSVWAFSQSAFRNSKLAVRGNFNPLVIGDYPSNVWIPFWGDSASQVPVTSGTYICYRIDTQSDNYYQHIVLLIRLDDFTLYKTAYHNIENPFWDSWRKITSTAV